MAVKLADIGESGILSNETGSVALFEVVVLTLNQMGSASAS